MMLLGAALRLFHVLGNHEPHTNIFTYAYLRKGNSVMYFRGCVAYGAHVNTRYLICENISFMTFISAHTMTLCFRFVELQNAERS